MNHNRVWTAIPRFTWLTDISVGAAAGADILIAIVMCFALRGQNSTFTNTRAILQWLVIYIAGTGLITT